MFLFNKGFFLLTRGNIFVISAPSGAGKSSLVKELCKLDAHIKVSISHTTRNIRVGEKDAVAIRFCEGSLIDFFFF